MMDAKALDRLTFLTLGLALSALAIAVGYPFIVRMVVSDVDAKLREVRGQMQLYQTDGLPRLRLMEERLDKLEQGAR